MQWGKEDRPLWPGQKRTPEMTGGWSRAEVGVWGGQE
jgi:hypothetical protein